MSLKDYTYRLSYNTDEHDVPNEFYCKALSSSVLYRRAAGFFSSSSLVVISNGLQNLIHNGGKMQLLISPNLTQKDIEAIRKGLEGRDGIIENSLKIAFEKIENEKNPQVDEAINYLAWLIYSEKLEIRVVVRKDDPYLGMFHDKFGIIYDDDNNRIGFHGSMNDSETAYINNYEGINVFLSWEKREIDRVLELESRFLNIWENKGASWDTYDIPDAIRTRILMKRSEYKPLPVVVNEGKEGYLSKKVIKIPDSIKLRDYQKDAIKAWFEADANGIFEMATGTGKTFTSICAMVKLYEQYEKKNTPMGIVIVVPYKVLLEQWVENLSEFGISPILCYENKDKWLDEFEKKLVLFNNSINKELFIITTNATFGSLEFQKKLNEINQDYIFCADEMHHLVSKKMRKTLPNNAKFRLGLSATLMTKFESENMSKLIDYFNNGIVYRFSLERAINEGFLTPYKYYPIFVELTPEEKENYFEITSKIGKVIAMNGFDEDDENLMKLFVERSRLIASAENKIKELIKMKEKIKSKKYNIFYCGDKKESNLRYVEKVNGALANDIGIKTHTFTSNESRHQRDSILESFKNGDYDALTAIRCLDEGVDIPKLERAFIMSSGTNPKEFIQRRGRILRKSPGKMIAEIYDFVVVPTLDREEIKIMDLEELNIEKKIINREFERFKEFAGLAINKDEAYAEIISIWQLYE